MPTMEILRQILRVNFKFNSEDTMVSQGKLQTYYTLSNGSRRQGNDTPWLANALVAEEEGRNYYTLLVIFY